MSLPIEQGESIDEWTTLEALGLASSQLRHLSTRGSFSREDGVSIQFCNFRQENAKHHVLLLTGWDESFLKYGDVISELLAGGFNVYAMDWRSQGLSGRLLLDPQVTYVESFDDHIEDLTFFVNQVVVGSCGVSASQLTCLAHSMGGLLSLMAAAGDRGLFQRLVACSPMLRMRAGMPHPVALRLGGLLCRLGLGKWYAPGEGGVDVARRITKKLTTNRERLSQWEKVRRAFPIVAMGGMSNRWVVEAIKAQDCFQDRAGQVKIPVLLLEADIDVFVCTSRPFSHLCRAARYCRRLRYPTTYHEVLFERDWARSHAMKASIAFLKSGEYPAEEELTVVSPPTPPSPPPALRLAELAKSLCFFCRGARLFARGEGEVQSEKQGEGRKATLACLGLAAVVGLGAVGIGVAVFTASCPSGGGSGGRGGGPPFRGRYA